MNVGIQPSSTLFVPCHSSVFSVSGMVFLFGFVYPQLKMDSIYVLLESEKSNKELANDVWWAGFLYFLCFLASMFFIFFPGALVEWRARGP